MGSCESVDVSLCPSVCSSDQSCQRCTSDNDAPSFYCQTKSHPIDPHFSSLTLPLTLTLLCVLLLVAILLNSSFRRCMSRWLQFPASRCSVPRCVEAHEKYVSRGWGMCCFGCGALTILCTVVVFLMLIATVQCHDDDECDWFIKLIGIMSAIIFGCGACCIVGTFLCAPKILPNVSSSSAAASSSGEHVPAVPMPQQLLQLQLDYRTVQIQQLQQLQQLQQQQQQQHSEPQVAQEERRDEMVDVPSSTSSSSSSDITATSAPLLDSQQPSDF